MKYNFNNNLLKIAYKVLTILLIIIWAIFLLFGLSNIIEKSFLYPKKYSEYVLKYSDRYSIDSNLIYAIIKAESGFNPNAVSKAGAVGLMQISSDTAKYIASQLNVDSYELLNPKTNIEFGCYYINYLAKKFYSLDLILCSYNAGEGTVYNWLSDKRYSEDGVSLKIVPYRETSQYLIKVKNFFEKYTKLYGNILDK